MNKKDFQMPVYHEPDFNQDFLKNAPNAKLVEVERDGISPYGYHALSVFPEYFKVNGKWVLATESRMDTVCVAIDEPGKEAVDIVEFRNLKKGDKVVVGRTEDASEGIYVYADGFNEEKETNSDVFAFRSGRSRETAFSKDFDNLYDVLKYEHAHNGHVTWIIGSAVVMDKGSREALVKLIREGYVQTIFCGNCTAALDLEQAVYGTCWGQSEFVQEQNSNTNLYRVINAARRAGSLAAYVADNKVKDGFVKACVEMGVELIMAGTIRDRFTLPGVIDNVYQAQNAMRAQIRKTSTVIFVSAILYTIASGNMTPSYNTFGDDKVRPVYMYTIDIQEFAVNKLSDRGTLTATSIVTNAQDFMRNIGRALD